jgi:hypothetical protein
MPRIMAATMPGQMIHAISLDVATIPTFTGVSRCDSGAVSEGVHVFCQE